ncbi:GAF domain-containing protein [Streptomyces sp. NBC_01264]|uniref:GAF domain-containing protein n=1 Tax=Streptomyces sp. NBC_01264 TaxID=2903804 RepID=UPI002250554F|nr:GAF domain-containing protein [Streptomyces sp. NBC_01264]MCX4782619.1 GAF domain-containing protein [Streptomyces sp. NBC_01264]
MKPWPHDLMATERRLLQSVVTVARYIYGAAASSVFMVSPDTGELIFAAVAGEGEQGLVGRRFEPGTGIAGWVAASGQPLITDDVGATDRFARDAAASTGYVPASIMAAPLIADGECIGVIEVLDRHAHAEHAPGRELDDIELLGLLATQAALSLALLRRSEQAASGGPRLGELVARLSEHAVMDASDPLAVSLLSLSLDLLDRGAHPGSKVV